MNSDDRPADRPWASVPISAIEHFAYCRRQAALIHLDRYFSDNAETQRGHLEHEIVDRGGPSVSRDGTRCWHALAVADDELGVHGICDVVELHPDGPVPVEHKSGSYRPGSATDLQIAAQVVCLRTMFNAKIPTGIVFAGRHRRRFDVVIDEALVGRLRAVVEELRGMLRAESFRHRSTTGDATDAHYARAACPKRVAITSRCSHPNLWENGMPELLRTLFITTPGTSLHLENETVRIYHPDKPGRNILPLLRIDHIVMWNGVDISDDQLMRCANDARGVTWLSRNGRLLARVTGSQTGNMNQHPDTIPSAATPARAGWRQPFGAGEDRNSRDDGPNDFAVHVAPALRDWRGSQLETSPRHQGHAAPVAPAFRTGEDRNTF